MNRAALWARVSTKHREQDAEQQIGPLEQLAEREHLDVVKKYVVNESGRIGNRYAFRDMLEDAEARQFDVLLFWSFNRFCREGIRNSVGYVQRLEMCGVRIISLNEPYLNTQNELFRHIVLGVLADIARSEAEETSRAVKRGLKAARAKGKRLGRPTKLVLVQHELIKLKALGLSDYSIAKRLGLSHNTVKKYVNILRDEIEESTPIFNPMDL